MTAQLHRCQWPIRTEHCGTPTRSVPAWAELGDETAATDAPFADALPPTSGVVALEASSRSGELLLLPPDLWADNVLRPSGTVRRVFVIDCENAGWRPAQELALVVSSSAV